MWDAETTWHFDGKWDLLNRADISGEGERDINQALVGRARTGFSEEFQVVHSEAAQATLFSGGEGCLNAIDPSVGCYLKVERIGFSHPMLSIFLKKGHGVRSSHQTIFPFARQICTLLGAIRNLALQKSPADACRASHSSRFASKWLNAKGCFDRTPGVASEVVRRSAC